MRSVETEDLAGLGFVGKGPTHDEQFLAIVAHKDGPALRLVGMIVDEPVFWAIDELRRTDDIESLTGDERAHCPPWHLGLGQTEADIRANTRFRWRLKRGDLDRR